MAAEEITRSREDQSLELIIRAGEGRGLGVKTRQLLPYLPGVISPVLTSCQREISVQSDPTLPCSEVFVAGTSQPRVPSSQPPLVTATSV